MILKCRQVGEALSQSHSGPALVELSELYFLEFTDCSFLFHVLWQNVFALWVFLSERVYSGMEGVWNCQKEEMNLEHIILHQGTFFCEQSRVERTLFC